MDEDQFRQAFSAQALREQFRDQQRIKDEAMAHNIHQLAFGSTSAGSILSAASITSNVSTLAATAATNVYGTSGTSQYYKKEVDDAALFMDNKLTISPFNVYTICTKDSMYKFDDMSAISLSSSCAITEYFNVMYCDKLSTPGSECNYTINETKNVVKHLSFSTQTIENIAQHSGEFPVGKIKYKWDNLHKALI